MRCKTWWCSCGCAILTRLRALPVLPFASRLSARPIRCTCTYTYTRTRSRANTFVGASTGGDPSAIDVPVIGGHAGITILPLFSQVPGYTPGAEELDAITHRTQFGGDEVVQAKAGAGSATLSMAYAGYLFTDKVLQAMNGADDIVQCAYVASDVTDASFFSSPCKFGPEGVEEVRGFGAISEYEEGWLNKMLPDLKAQIQKGIDFANQ